MHNQVLRALVWASRGNSLDITDANYVRNKRCRQ